MEITQVDWRKDNMTSEGWYYFRDPSGEIKVMQVKIGREGVPAALTDPANNKWTWVVDLALGGTTWYGPIDGRSGETMKKALEFYADPNNWKNIYTAIGDSLGVAHDYGARAREALGMDG
jgi:hypothetical protein